jgi:hypothetical protein
MLDKTVKLEPSTANNSCKNKAEEQAGPSRSALASNLGDFSNLNFNEATNLEFIAEGGKRERVEEQDLPEIPQYRGKERSRDGKGKGQAASIHTSWVFRGPFQHGLRRHN